MIFKRKNWMFCVCSFCLACTLFTTSFVPTHAKKTVNDLESDISNLNQKLNDWEENLDDIANEINSISKELQDIQQELAIAKGKEEAQYESMKLRIKYMYENGNFSFFEILVSSGSIAELISKAELYSALTEYDRKMLDELLETQESIAEKEKTLSERQSYLVAIQEGLDKKIADASGELSSLNASLKKARADAKAAEEEAKKEVKPITPNKPTTTPSPSKPPTTNQDPIETTDSDVELLAALLECEAGSTNYEALLAVGSVVVNRMKSPYYPNTLRGVIFQSGQFPPALNGKVDRILARGVKPLCVEAARDALNGKNNVGGCLSFRASSSGRPGIVIGDNVFF